MCVCVCVRGQCVIERERERDREGASERETERERAEESGHRGARGCHGEKERQKDALSPVAHTPACFIFSGTTEAGATLSPPKMPAHAISTPPACRLIARRRVATVGAPARSLPRPHRPLVIALSARRPGQRGQAGGRPPPPPSSLLPALLAPAAVAFAVLLALGTGAVLLPLVLAPFLAPFIILPVGLAIGAAAAASALAVPVIVAVGFAAAAVGLLGSGVALALQVAALGAIAAAGAGLARAISARSSSSSSSSSSAADSIIDIDGVIIPADFTDVKADADDARESEEAQSRRLEAEALARFDAELDARVRARQVERGERWDK